MMHLYENNHIVKGSEYLAVGIAEDAHSQSRSGFYIEMDSSMSLIKFQKIDKMAAMKHKKLAKSALYSGSLLSHLLMEEHMRITYGGR